MKKIFNWLLPMALLLGACAQEELVFDHEQPAFDTKDGKILLEVVVPSTTSADDVIAISGAFNGANDSLALLDAAWQLERSTKISTKWGIYLDPATFEAGKTLADGYHFVSGMEGIEMTAKGDTLTRTESPGPGTRTNLYVSKWESSFVVSEIPRHDGHRIYVYDQTGWDALALYGWGDGLPELAGGWPGQKASETTIAGNVWKYFEFPEGLEGTTYNLIFNNNGAGAQFDGPAYSFDKVDYFLGIKVGSFEEVEDPLAFEVVIPEVKLFVIDETGWSDLRVYAKQNGEPVIFGNWPGAEADEVLSGTDGAADTLVFNIPADYFGAAVELVFNSSEAKVLPDVKVTFDSDQYVTVREKTEEAYRIYLDDQTGWDAVAVYAYGPGEIFGGWPGALMTETETRNGKEYKYVEIPFEYYGKDANLIFNNNGGGVQLADYNVTEIAGDIYLVATAEGVAVDEGASSQNGVKVYVNDQTGWKTGAHYWNADGFTTTWPGVDLVSAPTKDVNGVTYKYFEVDPAAGNGTIGIIFHHQDDNTETVRVTTEITVDKDRYYTLTTTSLTEDAIGMEPEPEPEPEPDQSVEVVTTLPQHDGYRVYVLDETGFAKLHLYQYGAINDLGGGWPGKETTGKISFNDVVYNYFQYTSEDVASLNGGSQNFILNNGSGGDGNQFDVTGTFDFSKKDIFLKATSSLTAEEIDNPFNK